MTRGARDRLVNDPNSLGERARRKRWSMFLGVFPDLASCSVLDLGGTVEFWRRVPVRPASVDVVNVAVDSTADDEQMRVIEGDACELPSTLDGRRYDIVFSNSVIEHVGGHDRRSAFAATVRERADRHWIQTPYRYFPVEPHYVFPGAQFLPSLPRSWVARYWPLTHAPGVDEGSAVGDALSIELLDVTQMRYYFPDSDIARERLLGLSKSLIAVRA
jgi:hypothetical protein